MSGSGVLEETGTVGGTVGDIKGEESAADILVANGLL